MNECNERWPNKWVHLKWLDVFDCLYYSIYTIWCHIWIYNQEKINQHYEHNENNKYYDPVPKMLMDCDGYHWS